MGIEGRTALMKSAPLMSEEATLLAKALESSGLTKAAVAEHLGVTPRLVSQWTTGRRPVTPEMAIPLGKLLDIPAVAISATLRSILIAIGEQAVPTAVNEDKREHAKRILNLENEIQALNLSLGSMLAVMVEHRTAEATDLADSLRRHVPAKLRERGLVQELLKQLDKAPKKK